ncbi:MAG: endo alpha-1,4 polygalactosaminidase, partial [Anaerolineales bacterium]
MWFRNFLTNGLILALTLSACEMNPGEDSASASRHPTPASPTNGVLPTPMISPVSPSKNWWRPTIGLTWQWQIGNNDIDTSIDADVYDIDLYVDQLVIDELHAKGHKVICYINVGSWEDWRPDKDKF